MRNDQFDEMQKQKRDKIGHQSLHMMFYMLWLDILLHSAGVRWLAYPADLTAIISVVCGVYVVRLIAAGAYTPAKRSLGTGTRIVLAVTIAIAVGVAYVALRTQVFDNIASQSEGSGPAVIIVLVSVVALAVIFITEAARKWMNRRGGDED